MKQKKEELSGLDGKVNPRQYTFIDVFAGCGGLSLGLMKAGWKGLFAVEHDKFAFQTLKYNLIDGANYSFDWPEWLSKTPHDAVSFVEKHEQELEALSGKVDMLVGGPPCQGFSSAGRRDPTDPRNKMVEAYLSFVSKLKPRFVVLENVRGFTSDFEESDSKSEKINYSKWIIDALRKDYKVFTNVLNTSDFGVPQNRRRFFIIAERIHASNVEFVDIFDELMVGLPSFLSQKKLSGVPVSAGNAISDLEIAKNNYVDSHEFKGFKEIFYKGKPNTEYQKLMNENLLGLLSDTRLARHAPHIIERFGKIIKISHETGRLAIALSPEVRASFGLRKCAIRVLDPDAPAPTITSMPDDLIHYSEPRTLTVRENARLQSFPDWFEFKGKYTTGGDRRRKEVPRFTQVANAVPPLIAEAIGRAIFKRLELIEHLVLSRLPISQKFPDIQEAPF